MQQQSNTIITTVIFNDLVLFASYFSSENNIIYTYLSHLHVLSKAIIGV